MVASSSLLLVESYKSKNNKKVIADKKTINKKKNIVKEVIPKSSQKYTQNKSNHLCSKCKFSNIEINYGKFGYYFKCLDCDGNTKIKLECNNKDCKPKIKKQKKKFFKVCEKCEEETLFFENK